MLVFFLIIDICVLYGATIVEARKVLLEGYVAMQHGDVILGTKVGYCIII
jgi:hypothetical protein